VETTPEVSVAVRRSPQEALSVALGKLSVPLQVPRHVERVVVKPSLLSPDLPGNTTLEFIRALVHKLESFAPVTIVESDNPLRTAEHAFTTSGYQNLEKKGVSLLNLSSAQTTEIEMSGHMFKKRAMPTILTGHIYLVDAATLKFDPAKKETSASIKNLFGLLPEADKSAYHTRLDDCLLDLLISFRPNLTLVDLTQIVVGPRETGVTRKVGGVVVGTDPVAVDAYCASIVGIDPLTVSHIRRAHDLGLGEALIDRIRVVGTENQKRLMSELCRVK